MEYLSEKLNKNVISYNQIVEGLADILTPELYGTEWSLTTLLREKNNNVKQVALHMLFGKNEEGQHEQPPWILGNATLEVANRIVVHQDKSGKLLKPLEKIKKNGDDAPAVEGDIILFKKSLKRKKNGQPLSPSEYKDLLLWNEPTHNYTQFVVDSNHQILCSFQDGIELLSRFGTRLSPPKWRTLDEEKGIRKVINWGLKEVI